VLLARSLSTDAGILTRLARFRRHAAALHASDPATWTDRTLSRHFGVPLDRVQAVLALQQIEAEAEAAGELDADADDLDAQVEAILVPDDAEQLHAATLRRLDSAAAAAGPDPTLRQLSRGHEEALASRLAERLGAGGSLDDAEARASLGRAAAALLEGLTAEERAELAAAVTDGQATSLPDAFAQMDVDGDGVLSRAEFDAAAAHSEAEWAAAPGGLLQLALQGGGGGEGDGGAEAAAERDEGVTRVEVLSDNPKGTPKFLVVDDFGPEAERYVPRRLEDKSPPVRSVDGGDALAASVDKRAANLTGGRQRVKRTGTTLVVDAGRRKQRKEVWEVWAVDRDGQAREPSDEERRRAVLKEKAPQLLSRVKRNWQ